MSVQGCDVVLDSQAYLVPQCCASCGAAQQTSLQTLKSKGLGTRKQTFSIPYCNACAGRVKEWSRRQWRLGLATLGLALALAALGLALPQWPLLALIGAPTLLCAAFAVVGMIVRAPKAPPKPATARGEAVRLVAFGPHRYVLFCVNADWGRAFARANGVAAEAKQRVQRFAVSSLVIALVATPLASLVVWTVAHPRIVIDNAGTGPLQIWLDGQPVQTVLPGENQNRLNSVFVTFGTHRLGYSNVGATAPVSTIEARVPLAGGEHVYNPGKTACYELRVDRYGSAKTDDVPSGPQARHEFYTFERVDNWFRDNPSEMSVSFFSRGGYQIALQRAPSCPTQEN